MVQRRVFPRTMGQQVTVTGDINGQSSPCLKRSFVEFDCTNVTAEDYGGTLFPQKKRRQTLPATEPITTTVNEVEAPLTTRDPMEMMHQSCSPATYSRMYRYHARPLQHAQSHDSVTSVVDLTIERQLHRFRNRTRNSQSSNSISSLSSQGECPQCASSYSGHLSHISH
eukprot:Clim_evm82s236 gene=Clim_evmTU82s236